MLELLYAALAAAQQAGDTVTAEAISAIIAKCEGNGQGNGGGVTTQGGGNGTNHPPK